MSHCGRKRPRSCEEECCELMPISKRINDLHIRSGASEPSNMHPPNCNTHNIIDSNIYMNNNQRNEIGNKDLNMPTSYDPGLTATENPYYYHSNGILYEAHLSRLQRLAKSMS